MIYTLTKEESKRMNKELLEWADKALDGEYSVYIYNILLNLKHFIESLERKG